MNTLTQRFAAIAALTFLLIPALPAAPDAPGEEDKVESVTLKSGALVAIVDGQSIDLTNAVRLGPGLEVNTNGTFKVAGGKERSLREGQTLGRDRRLTSPDGSVLPIDDHVSVRAGRVHVVRDGETQALSTPLALADGTRVHPDGRVISPRNVTRRLLDGQVLRLDATGTESTDTARLEHGRVVLYKDGGQIELRPGQVMAMADGSRIDATGLIFKRDGSQVKLKPGELYKFSGAGDSR